MRAQPPPHNIAAHFSRGGNPSRARAYAAYAASEALLAVVAVLHLIHGASGVHVISSPPRVPHSRPQESLPIRVASLTAQQVSTCDGKLGFHFCVRLGSGGNPKPMLAWTHLNATGVTSVWFYCAPEQAYGWCGWGISPNGTMLGSDVVVAYANVDNTAQVKAHTFYLGGFNPFSFVKDPSSGLLLTSRTDSLAATYTGAGMVVRIYGNFTGLNGTSTVIWQGGPPVTDYAGDILSIHGDKLRKAATVNWDTGASSPPKSHPPKALRPKSPPPRSPPPSPPTPSSFPPSAPPPYSLPPSPPPLSPLPRTIPSSGSQGPPPVGSASSPLDAQGETTVPAGGGESKVSVGLIAGVAGAVVLLLVLLVAGIMWWRRSQAPKVDEIYLGSWRQYRVEELRKGTDNFSKENCLGRGAYGEVFKGFVYPDGITRHAVAVKRIVVDRRSLQFEKVRKSFENEAKILCEAKHRNLVRLLGYCCEDENLLLVLDYVDGGDLRKLLDRDNRTFAAHSVSNHETGQGSAAASEALAPLKWKSRIRLALGAATGIKYLHQEGNNEILHLDIKSANILVNTQYEAKVADFGVSKYQTEGDGATTLHLRGTPGYIDPCFAHDNVYNKKSDVYSFGVVLLEIATGHLACADGNNLVNWVCDTIDNKGFHVLPPQAMRRELSNFEVYKRLVCLGLWCCAKTREKRPQMLQVVQTLEAIQRGEGGLGKEACVLLEAAEAHESTKVHREFVLATGRTDCLVTVSDLFSTHQTEGASSK